MEAHGNVSRNTARVAWIFELYPRGSDVEVLGALRFLMEVEGVPAPWLEARADLDPGAVDGILSGEIPPSDTVVRRRLVQAGVRLAALFARARSKAWSR